MGVVGLERGDDGAGRRRLGAATGAFLALFDTTLTVLSTRGRGRDFWDANAGLLSAMDKLNAPMVLDMLASPMLHANLMSDVNNQCLIPASDVPSLGSLGLRVAFVQTRLESQV